jgi:hypothetical protein
VARNTELSNHQNVEWRAKLFCYSRCDWNSSARETEYDDRSFDGLAAERFAKTPSSLVPIEEMRCSEHTAPPRMLYNRKLRDSGSVSIGVTKKVRQAAAHGAQSISLQDRGKLPTVAQ